MFLKNKGCLRQSISIRQMQRESGQVEWVMGYFFLLLLLIILCTRLQLDTYFTTAVYLEDALAASNLASAVIDLEEYGISHTILVDNPRMAYERFCTAVRGNLQLNENWECENKELINGKVSIADYRIYNVNQKKVTVYKIGMDGEISAWQGELGGVIAPNGITIESTSIYSEITFPVSGFGGFTVEAHKGKLVDIAGNAEGK